jgi:hypothetical protein
MTAEFAGARSPSQPRAPAASAARQTRGYRRTRADRPDRSGAGRVARCQPGNAAARRSAGGVLRDGAGEGGVVPRLHGRACLFPSPPVGEGGRDAQRRGRVRGLSPRKEPFGVLPTNGGQRPPMATFSHKGRREESNVGFKFQTAIGYASAFSRRDAPEVCISFTLLRKRRAQGKPGADCTRGRAHKKRTSGPQVQPDHSGFPCAMVLRLTSCSPR